MKQIKVLIVSFLCLFSLLCSGLSLSASNVSYDINYNIYSGHVDSVEFPAVDGIPDLVLKAEHIIILAFEIVIPILVDNEYGDIVLCGQADGTYVECTPVGKIDKSGLNREAHNYIQGDFNGDGFEDLLLQAKTANQTSLLLLGDSSGQLQFEKQVDDINGNPISADLVNLTVVDVNGDGTDELLFNGVNPTGVYNPSDIQHPAIAVKSYSLPTASAKPANANDNSNGVGAINASFDVSPGGKPIYPIPITLPPSVTNIAPDLALVYSGQDSNDFMGVGWYLQGLSSIDRCPTTLEQDGFTLGVNFLSNDKFCLNGQRLKLISGVYGANGAEYRTENESFTKIISYGTLGSGPSYFKVWKSTGEIEVYGNTANSKRTNKNGTEVVSWAINELQDRQNNTVQFLYKADALNGVHHIDQIKFGANSVKFAYQPRTDVIISNANGGYSRKATRLNRITTYVGTVEARSYQLNYEYGIQTGKSRLVSIVECAQVVYCLPATVFNWDLTEPAFAYSPAFTVSDTSNYPTGKNYDKQQYLVGDVNKDGRSDLVWTYRDPGLNKIAWVLYLTDGTTGKLTYTSSGQETGYAVSGIEEKDFSFVMGDVNGDGRSDLVLAVRRDQDFYRNIYLAAPNGQGFTPQGYQADSNSEYLKYKEGRYLLADVNADGRQDLVWFFIMEGKLGRAVYQAINDNNNQLGFARTSVEFDTNLSPLFYNDQNFMAGDVNGDNKTDVVWLFTFNNAIYRALFLANGSGSGFYKVSVQKDNFGGSTLENVKNPLAHLGDVNGDTKADLVFTYDSDNTFKRRVYLSSELGISFDKVQESTDTTVSTDTFSKSNASLADLNGDGLTDLLYTYVQNTQFGWVSYLAKLDGSGFVRKSANTTDNASTFTENQNHLTGDINADGKTDLIWAYNTSDNNTLYKKAFTLPTSNPDHITKITDGLNNITNIHYTYLSQTLYSGVENKIFQPSTGSTYPIRDDIGLSYVVDRVEISNGLGNFNTWDYVYQGAKTHLRGRGFLGFESRQIKDNQTNFITKEKYLQNFPYIGLLSAEETFDVDNDPIKLTYNHWKSTALNLGKTTFRYLHDTAVINYELGGSSLNASISANQYDTSNGNLLSNAKSIAQGINNSVILAGFNPLGTFVPSQLNALALTVTATNDYLHENTADWRTGFLSQQTISYQANGETLRQVATKFTPYNNYSHLVGKQENYVGSNVWATNNYQYDTFGNLTQTQTLAANAVTRVETQKYTTDGLFLENFINGENQPTDYSFNPYNGTLLSETDPNGRVKTTLYDDFGRLVYARAEDGQETNFIYSNGGAASNSAYTVATTTSHALETGRLPSQWQEFDALGRELRNEAEGFNGTRIRINTNYDSRGRVVLKSEPHYANASAPNNLFNWDNLDRLELHSKPDGGSLAYTYISAAAEGFSAKENIRHTVILPSGGSKIINTSQYRNSLGQVSRSIDAESTPSDYRYDSQGNLSWIQVNNDPLSQVFVRYDVAGNKVEIDDPDAGIVSMTYDGLSNELTKTHGVGAEQVTSTSTYDKLSRLTSRQDASTSDTEVYTWRYDQTTNAIGLLTELSGPNYFQKISYDLFGRTETDAITLFNDTSARTIVYHYDGFSRPEVLGYPSGLAVKNNYNLVGYLTSTEDYSTAKVYRTITEMDAFGNITRQTLGNGMLTQRQYKPQNGYIESIRSGTNNALQNYAYSFDTAGNLYSRTSSRPNENITENFTYDNLHRLKTASTSGLASGTRSINYSYDKLGNIKTKTDISDANGYLYGGNGAGIHGVSSISKTGQTAKQYHYDSRGNVTQSDQRVIAYTVQNNPKTIMAGVNKSVEFEYSPDNKVISQSIELDGLTQTTRYYHNGLYEISKTATELFEKQYLGDYLVHRRKLNASDEFQYLYRDHLGSVDIVTNETGVPLNYLDQNNTKAELRMAFDPWGKRRYHNWETGDTGLNNQMVDLALRTTAHGFTDHLSLDSLGLIHMQGRVYDPEIGRFLSPDFYIQYPYLSQSYNRYSYVLNNPLSYTDPSGELIPLVAIGIGAVALYRAYSTYDLVTSGVADLKTAADNDASTSDRVFAALSLGSNITTGKFGRVTTGKIKKIYDKRKANRSEANKVSQTKESSAQGNDKNTQRKAENCQGNSCRCSFEAGTPVMTPDGLVGIETLSAGDLVLAKNEATGEQGYKEINHAYSHKHTDGIELWLESKGNTEQITTTSEHPFFVNGKGFIAAAELEVGMQLMEDDGELSTISAIDKTPFNVVAYNFEVNEFHTYFVGNNRVWVHNDCDDSKDSASDGKDVPNSTVKANKVAGDLGEDAVRARLLNSNSVDLVGEQVRINTPGVGSHRVTDFLVRGKNTGKMRIIEVKTGGATRNSSQLAKDSLIADPASATTFSGRRARAAGFPNGTPTGGIKTYEVNASNLNR